MCLQGVCVCVRDQSILKCPHVPSTYLSILYLIYLFIYFICPFLYLFIHFSSSVFIGVSDRQEARGRYRILKEKKKIKEDLNGYHHWLNTGCKCLIKG